MYSFQRSRTNNEMGVQSQKRSNIWDCTLKGWLAIFHYFSVSTELTNFFSQRTICPRLTSVLLSVLLLDSFWYVAVCSSTQVIIAVVWPLGPNRFCRKPLFNYYLLIQVLSKTYSIVSVCDNAFRIESWRLKRSKWHR